MIKEENRDLRVESSGKRRIGERSFTIRNCSLLSILTYSLSMIITATLTIPSSISPWRVVVKTMYWSLPTKRGCRVNMVDSSNEVWAPGVVDQFDELSGLAVEETDR